MKYYSYLFFCISILFACGLAACNDDPDVMSNAPHLQLEEPSDLLRTSVTLNGMLVSDDPSTIRECGFKIGSTSALGDDATTIRMDEIPAGDFSALVKGLEIGQPYFYAAYVSNGRQTMFSEVRALTTLTRSGALVTDLTLTDAATCKVRAVVEDDGGAEVQIAGFCWNTTPSPTVYDDNVRVKPIGDGSFSAALSRLEANVTYYVRAFADNALPGTESSSITYSEQLEIRLDRAPENPDDPDDPENPDDPEKTFVTIPDANFKAYLVANFDRNGDGEISLAEAELITRIGVCTDNIESMEGIEKMKNLKLLDACGPTKDGALVSHGLLKSLNIRENTALQSIHIFGNQLTALDVSQNTELTFLHCGANQLTTLDISNNTLLTQLWCQANQLTNLDVSQNTALTYLDCSSNQLTSLDVSQNTALTDLHCNSNRLTSLDVSQNTALIGLYCGGNQLTSLDVSQNPELMFINCVSNRLTSLGVSQNKALTTLSCSANQLTTLDISNNTLLKGLWCEVNQLTSLDVSQNTALTTMYCHDNQLTSMDVSQNTALITLDCYNNRLTSLDISNNVNLTAFDARFNYNLKTIYVWSGFDKASDPNFKKEDWAEYVVKGSDDETIISIPDANFKTYLVANFDRNGDGEISQAEANAITEIEVYDAGIVSLVGIEKMRNLSVLDVDDRIGTEDLEYNGTVEVLNVSQNTKLKSLECHGNPIKMLDVSQNTALTYLDCQSTQLFTLDISQNANLTYLNCDQNDLSELDVSRNTALEQLRCSNNRITSLDVTMLRNLSVLWCWTNPLMTLDFSANKELTELWCMDNQLKSLNVSENKKLKVLYCEMNDLGMFLDISANTALTDFHSYSNPNLIGIYVWPGFTESNYPEFIKDSHTGYYLKNN